MKRAIDIGPVDAAAIMTVSGKVRLRLLLTVEQLEALLQVAKSGDPDMKRTETQCNALKRNETPREEKIREEDDDEDDARARPPPQPPKVIDRADYVFVIEGSRAWIAWLDHKVATGKPRSIPTTTYQVGGEWKRGWWLPTLFPPSQPELAVGLSHKLTK